MQRTGSKLSHFHHSETLQWISGPCEEWNAFLYQRKWPCSWSRWENAWQPVFHVSSLLVSIEFLIVRESEELPDKLIEPASFIDGGTVAWNREGSWVYYTENVSNRTGSKYWELFSLRSLLCPVTHSLSILRSMSLCKYQILPAAEISYVNWLDKSIGISSSRGMRAQS